MTVSRKKKEASETKLDESSNEDPGRIITIVRMQFEKMPKDPKMICGDLNGNLEAFPSVIELIKEEGWTDIGNGEALCGGRPGSILAKQIRM